MRRFLLLALLSLLALPASAQPEEVKPLLGIWSNDKALIGKERSPYWLAEQEYKIRIEWSESQQEIQAFVFQSSERGADADNGVEEGDWIWKATIFERPNPSNPPYDAKGLNVVRRTSNGDRKCEGLLWDTVHSANYGYTSLPFCSGYVNYYRVDQNNAECPLDEPALAESTPEQLYDTLRENPACADAVNAIARAELIDVIDRGLFGSYEVASLELESNTIAVGAGTIFLGILAAVFALEETREERAEAARGLSNSLDDFISIITWKEGEDIAKKNGITLPARTAEIPNCNPEDKDCLFEDAKGLIYESNPKHKKFDKGKISREPTNGQAALDKSIRFSKNTTRRVGVDPKNNEIVVLDEHLNGVFHGHVRNFKQLETPMQNALRKAKMVDKKGRILIK